MRIYNFLMTGQKNDVDNVNLKIKEKNMTAIIGTSGSGDNAIMMIVQ